MTDAWAQLGKIMERERAEDWRKQQQRRDAERTRTAVTNNDYRRIVKNAPAKAAQIFTG